MFAVAFDDAVIVVEPFFHPPKEYPNLVGVHNVPHASFSVFVIGPGVHVEPPLLSYVKV